MLDSCKTTSSGWLLVLERRLFWHPWCSRWSSGGGQMIIWFWASRLSGCSSISLPAGWQAFSGTSWRCYQHRWSGRKLGGQRWNVPLPGSSVRRLSSSCCYGDETLPACSQRGWNEHTGWLPLRTNRTKVIYYITITWDIFILLLPLLKL